MSVPAWPAANRTRGRGRQQEERGKKPPERDGAPGVETHREEERPSVGGYKEAESSAPGRAGHHPHPGSRSAKYVSWGHCASEARTTHCVRAHPDLRQHARTSGTTRNDAGARPARHTKETFRERDRNNDPQVHRHPQNREHRAEEVGSSLRKAKPPHRLRVSFEPQLPEVGRGRSQGWSRDTSIH